jgi:hypothetical protein
MRKFSFKWIEDYLYRNRVIIIYSLLISICCYGYELFNFSLSIDEENNSFVSSLTDLRRIFIGRWGEFILRFLFIPNSVLPFLPTLIAILCIAFSSILYINSEKGDLTSKIIFCTIFISYPLHSYFLAFNHVSFSIGIGMLLSVISFLMAKKAMEERKINKWYAIVSIFALILSMSTYQGVLPIFIFLSISNQLILLINGEENPNKEIFRKIAGFIIIFCLSFVLYKIIDKAIRVILFIPFLKAAPNLDYLITWGHQPISKILTLLFKTTKRYLLGDSFYGGAMIKSLFLLVPLAIYFIFQKVKGFINRLYSLLLLLFLILCPFFIMFLIGTKLPPRALLALPLLPAFFWWFCYQYFNLHLKRFLLIATLSIFLVNTFYTTRLFYASYVAWRADRDMGNRIIERIYSLDLPVNANGIPVAFIGKYQHPGNELFLQNADVFGASFFCWADGKPARMNSFFKTLGFNEIKIVILDKNKKNAEEIRSINCWPKKGSVKLVDNIVIVKLSNQ